MFFFFLVFILSRLALLSRFYIAGMVDSSGVRLYITPDVREYDAGVIELGLEYTDKMAIPPNQPDFTLTGYCIAECTAVVSRIYNIVVVVPASVYYVNTVSKD